MKRQILTDVFSHNPPDALYHYTTQPGLLGILKNKEIWATHSQYLNDQREYLYALKIVKDEISLMADAPAYLQYKSLLHDMAADIEGIEGINVCVCSFSEDRDSLSQWRAYCGATSSFAIGFYGKMLAEVASDKRFYLARCIYDTSEQRALIRALLEEVLEENVEEIPWGDKDHLPHGGNLGAYLNRYAPILKDPSFKEEREWRIISRPLSCKSEGYEFRPGNSMLIPYYKLPLASENVSFDLAEVVLGPTPHPKQSKCSISSFLVSQNLKDIQVNNSEVPYRNW
jgi:hypothetical protein